jgi:chromosome segregation ATPase
VIYLHTCNKEQSIEKLKEEVMSIKTRLAVVESTITTIKLEIGDLSVTMEKFSDKFENRFEDINKKIMALMGFTIATLLGVLINILI